jgi:hypothetical protein
MLLRDLELEVHGLLHRNGELVCTFKPMARPLDVCSLNIQQTATQQLAYSKCIFKQHPVCPLQQALELRASMRMGWLCQHFM